MKSTDALEKLSKTALLAGAALALPSVSKAGVVFVNSSNGVPFTLTSPQGSGPATQTIDLDLADLGAHPDFTFGASGGATGSSNNAEDTVLALSNSMWVGPASNPFGNAAPLPLGTQIGGTLDPAYAYYTGTGTLQKVKGDPTLNAQKGPWPTDGSSAFLGVQFSDTNSMIHYGWVQLSACVPDDSGASNTCNDPNGILTVNAYAYQSDPNTSIQAGQTTNASVTPEPASILLFALGAAGLAAYRRRKQAAQ